VASAAFTAGRAISVQGVTIEGNTSTPWGAAAPGANPLLRAAPSAADVAWRPAQRGDGGGVRQLELLRLALPAERVWDSLVDPAAGGGRRRRSRRNAARAAR
jgi:hypothetical protein